MSTTSVPARHGARRRMLTPYLLVSPTVVLLAVFFLTPLGIMIVYSFYTHVPGGTMTADFTVANYQRFFETPLYRHVLLETLRLSLITTAVTLVLSYPLAYWLVRVGPRWLNLALLALVIAFWTSIVVRAFAWMVLLGRNGIVNDFFGFFGLGPFHLVFNELGVVIGLVHVMIPYIVFPIYASLRAIDPSLEQAAEGLGATPVRRFLRVTLPLSLPGVAAGALLVFIICSGFFLTPALLGGGRVAVIATFVQQQVGLLNYPLASALSVVLLVVVLGLAAVFNRYIGMRRVAAGFDVG